MKSEIVRKNSPLIHWLVATLGLLPLPLMAQQINRTVLPVPEPQPPTITELDARNAKRSEEHTSELQSRFDLVCRLLLEKKNNCRNLKHRDREREQRDAALSVDRAVARIDEDSLDRCLRQSRAAAELIRHESDGYRRGVK